MSQATAAGPRAPRKAGVIMWRREISPLELRSVGQGEWRLSDARMPEDDARHLIAFIESSERGVEVVWLRSPHPAWTTFTGLDAALSAAAEVVDAEFAADTRQPLPIAHFPPPTSRVVTASAKGARRRPEVAPRRTSGLIP